MSNKPVVVYGASGYTGRLVCEYLREYSLPFIWGITGIFINKDYYESSSLDRWSALVICPGSIQGQRDSSPRVRQNTRRAASGSV